MDVASLEVQCLDARNDGGLTSSVLIPRTSTCLTKYIYTGVRDGHNARVYASQAQDTMPARPRFNR